MCGVCMCGWGWGGLEGRGGCQSPCCLLVCTEERLLVPVRLNLKA